MNDKLLNVNRRRPTYITYTISLYLKPLTKYIEMLLTLFRNALNIFINDYKATFSYL